jgi:hypothetical protein
MNKILMAFACIMLYMTASAISFIYNDFLVIPYNLLIIYENNTLNLIGKIIITIIIIPISIIFSIVYYINIGIVHLFTWKSKKINF